MTAAENSGPGLNADRALALRNDFPFFTENEGAVFLDSAASSLTPQRVIDAVNDYYRRFSVNIHRGVYRQSAEATTLYENARENVKSFIKLSDDEELIFTRGTTESLNILALSLGRAGRELNPFFSGWNSGLGNGDVILITESEHHSNLVPWQMLAENTGARVEFVRVDKETGMIDFAHLAEIRKNLSAPVKIVSVSQVSNVTGIVHNLEPFRELAREKGAVFIVDAAQAVSHIPFYFHRVDADFIAFSAHKMVGPTGMGAFAGRREVLNAMPPVFGGGDMIDRVTREKTTYNVVPHRFEAGTPPIAQAFGFSAAVDYLSEIGMHHIHDYERELVEYGTEKILSAGIQLHGPVDKTDRTAVFSFTVPGIHPHDLGTILDEAGVSIRTGHHCCQVLMDVFCVPATARASLYLYNTPDDIDELLDAVKTARKIFGVSQATA